MQTKPEIVTVKSLQNLLRAGQERDNALARDFKAVEEATKGLDGKPLGKRFLTVVQKTIPNARYHYCGHMTSIFVGSDFTFLLSHNDTFREEDLRRFNSAATTGVEARTAKRLNWLTDEAKLKDLADKINAYNEARYALQLWDKKNGYDFPESLDLKGLKDQ